MKNTSYKDYPAGQAREFLEGIPFFKDLIFDNPEQLDLLLEHATFIELNEGDVLIKKKARDRMFYFVIKGQLAVYAEEKLGRKSTPVGSVSQGQVLGGLAMLTGLPRTATVAVEKGISSTTVFAIDCSPFGDTEDFSSVSLTTKLALYRIVINSIRFKLETYKSKDPSHQLAEIYGKIKGFSGDKGSAEELSYLARQATLLAKLLEKWNQIQ